MATSADQEKCREELRMGRRVRRGEDQASGIPGGSKVGGHMQQELESGERATDGEGEGG